MIDIRLKKMCNKPGDDFLQALNVISDWFITTNTETLTHMKLLT